VPTVPMSGLSLRVCTSSREPGELSTSTGGARTPRLRALQETNQRARVADAINTIVRSGFFDPVDYVPSGRPPPTPRQMQWKPGWPSLRD
jgi:hypothetical protein